MNVRAIFFDLGGVILRTEYQAPRENLAGRLNMTYEDLCRVVFDSEKQVYVLTPEEREHRDLLRTRRQIVDHRKDVARQIKSKLLFYGIVSPFSETPYWSLQYIEWLKALSFATDYLKESFHLLIDLYEYLTRQIARINRKAVLLCREAKYLDRIKLLCTAPGIGKLTAIEILAELQDISRFENGEELASYLGLTPSEYSTGEKTRQGKITRCGNTRVRT